MRKVFRYFVITATFACGSCMQGCSGEDFDEPWQDPEFETKAARTRSGNEVTYTFPHCNDIANSQTVIAKMDEAWSRTLASATSTGYQEYGFYIYVNHSNGSLYCGPMISGEIVSCGGTASITLGQISNNVDLCGCFHTHTPLDSCSISCYRNTGESDEDNDFVDDLGIPGLLYDYVRDQITNNTPRTAKKKVYKYGINRRKSFTTTE